jgi:rod shape-determining protein MreB
MFRFPKIITDIGVDLGTANTIVYAANKGYVVNEPSVVAYKNSSLFLCAGKEAKEMMGRTHKAIKVVRPLANGVIADFVAGEHLVREFIRKAGIPKFLVNKIVLGVPTGITSVEKKAVVESAESAGARKVFLVAEPMAAAIGVGLDVLGSGASMIVDIGGGTTDIAIINYGGIVVDKTLRIAGDDMNEAIIRNLKNIYHLRIGEKTAEEIKIAYGAVGSGDMLSTFSVKGMDNQKGIPRQLELSIDFFNIAFAEILEAIINAIISALDQLPPELAGDIIDCGIILTGGGALLKGLDDYIRERVNIPVSTPDNALFCVAEGTKKILQSFDKYKTVILR